MPEDIVQIKRTVPVPDFVANAAVAANQKSAETKYPTEVIPLPTQGWFYPDGHPLSSGNIELKQMTAREEDILANQELIKKGKVLDKLIESLLINKSIRTDDILIPDKNAIFVSIRRLAYGDDYPVSITCPQCQEEQKVNINLGSLGYKQFDFTQYAKGSNSFSFTLPVSQKQITYKILSQFDEQNIDSELAQYKKAKESKELTTRLTYLITSVDGNSDRNAIRSFVNNTLTSRDSLALRKHMRETNPDIDMSFDFKCASCDFERRTDVPLGASFLWPDIDFRG
jgi:hypothetical protein